ncbi:MAG TPA: HAMP domain-containing sensor histidine kinase [Caulobacteraceae bacterium]
MTLATAREVNSPIQAPAASPVSEELRNVLWWHCGWALALTVAAVVVSVVAPWSNGAPGLALIVGAAPAIAAIVALRWETEGSRIGLLAVWALAGAVAAGLTGGLTGPLAPWCLTPLAAAILLGARRISWGAVLSVLALASVALAQAAGLSQPPPTGVLDGALALVGLITITIGLAAAILLPRSFQTPARALHDEAPLAALVDAQPLLIAAFDADGRIVDAHGGLRDDLVLRLTEQGLIGAADPEAQAGIETVLFTAAQGGRGAIRFPLAGPEGVWLGLAMARSDDGRLIGVLHDATADQARETELEAARANAEALNIGKSRFLANMSHELRTPLNAIMGFSDIMRERIFGPLPVKYAEYAELIHDAGAHLLDLINDVLDMSKIEASKYELDLEELDTREPVSAALRLMRLQADDAGVQLRGLLPSEPLEGEADRRALKQIVLNLVSNALKFTPRGGLVTVSLQALAGALELSVADTGLGIAEGDLERLGRPYEQAGDAVQQSRGTGLGLSLVRAFAELHGGEMSIESRLGEGTAVTVRLPVLTEPQAAQPVEPPSESGGEVIAFKPQR